MALTSILFLSLLLPGKPQLNAACGQSIKRQQSLGQAL